MTGDPLEIALIATTACLVALLVAVQGFESYRGAFVAAAAGAFSCIVAAIFVSPFFALFGIVYGALAVYFGLRLRQVERPAHDRLAELRQRLSAREVAVTLPERRYDLAGRILAAAVHAADEGTGIRTAVARAAAEEGRAVGAHALATGAAPVSLVSVLAAYGYEPRTVGDQTVLANCPFRTLAVDHTELICGMNLEFVRAMTQQLGLTGVDVRLEPTPGQCCVTLRP